MANEIKTDLVLKATGKGFSKLIDDQGRINEAVKKGHQSQKQGFDGARKSATAFAKSMEKVMRSISGDRAAQRELAKLGKQFDDLDRKIQSVEKSLKRATEAKGAFLQGLVQGLGGGEFIQRGPGMGRQMAGRAVGTMASRGAGAMFTGTSGLVSAVQGIPGFGNLLAAPLQQAMGFSSQALGMQQQRLAAAPRLGMAQSLGRTQMMSNTQIQDMAIAAAAQAQSLPVDPASLVQRQQRQTKDRKESLRFMSPDTRAMVRAQMASEAIAGPQEDRGAAETRIRSERGKAAFAKEEGRLLSQRQKQRQVAMSGLRRIEQAGSPFGMSREETLQFSSQFAEAAGGRPGVGQITQGIAAQRVFGLDAGVTGTFARAGRRGGLAGGGGLMGALGGAERMGLEGQEIQNYLQQMAEGITRFEQTGIPINPTSIGKMGMAVAGSGLGGTRGAAFAGQLAAGSQRIGATGPTGAVDVLALQTLGGMKGTGSEDVLQAMERLEEGDFSAGSLQKFTKTIAQQGRGAGEFQQGRMVRQAFQSLGIRVGSRESRLMAKQAMGGQLDPDQRALVTSEQEKLLAGGRRADVTGATGVENLARALVDTVGPNIKKQSAIADKQLAIGEKILPSVQKLEATMTASTTAFTDVIAPLLTTLTGSMEKAALAAEKFVKIAQDKGAGAAVRDLAGL